MIQDETVTKTFNGRIIYPQDQYVSVEAIRTVGKPWTVGVKRVVSTMLPAILAFVFTIACVSH